MTQAVLVAHSYLTKAIEVVIESIVGFFKSIGKAIILAKQAEANRRVAHYLRCEYPKKTYEEIVMMLNQQTIDRIYK